MNHGGNPRNPDGKPRNGTPRPNASRLAAARASAPIRAGTGVRPVAGRARPSVYGTTRSTARTPVTEPVPGRGSAGTRKASTSRRPGTRTRRHGHQVRLTRRGRRVLVLGVVFVVLLVAAVGASAYVLVNRLPGNIARVDGTFAGIDEKQRPDKLPAAKNSLTFLLVGSDSRDTGPTTGSAAKRKGFRLGDRTDTIMMLNIPSDRRSATIISIPRDSWVDIPGHGKLKINAAYAIGGPSLLIRTVEQLTDVRIDHFAAIDFYGFRSIIDAIGGIDIQVPQATTDVGGTGASFRKGLNHFDGTKALAYVRQRHGLPGGDFDRVKRQQNMLRAVMAKVGTVDPTSNPVQTYKLLEAVTKAVSVDNGLSDADLRSLAFSMRDIRSGGVNFMTAPVTGTGMEGEESVVYLDQVRCGQLWTSVKNDGVATYVAQHKADLLPAVTR